MYYLTRDNMQLSQSGNEWSSPSDLRLTTCCLHKSVSIHWGEKGLILPSKIDEPPSRNASLSEFCFPHRSAQDVSPLLRFCALLAWDIVRGFSSCVVLFLLENHGPAPVYRYIPSGLFQFGWCEFYVNFGIIQSRGEITWRSLMC